MRPTLKDVARLAGVSPGTVSRVINNSGPVKAKTRARVEDAIRKLHYSPNSIARSLVTGQMNSFLLLVVQERPILPTTWAYELPIIEGICDFLKDKPQQLQISMCSREDLDHPNFVVNILNQRAVDGILLLSSYPIEFHTLSEFATRNIPYVLVGCRNLFRTLNQVEFDNVTPVSDAVRHLIKLGHEHFALISGLKDQLHMMDRTHGFRQALTESGLIVHDNLIKYGDYSRKDGYRCMRELLEEVPRPTAIIAGNDHMAVGAIRALRNEGYVIPRDFSIVGFDDSEVAGVVEPALTTIRAPLYEMGNLAVQKLVSQSIPSQMTGQEQDKSILLPCEIVHRESVGSVVKAA